MMHGKFYDIHEISPATQTGFFSLRRLRMTFHHQGCANSSFFQPLIISPFMIPFGSSLAHFSHSSTLPSIFKHLARLGDLLDRNIDEVFAATTAAAFHEPHSDSGPEEKREEVGDDERVDDLLGVARRRRPLLIAEPDAVEGSAGGVVGAQLARRRRFPTSDNVGEFPIPWRDVGPRRPVPDEL